MFVSSFDNKNWKTRVSNKREKTEDIAVVLPLQSPNQCFEMVLQFVDITWHQIAKNKGALFNNRKKNSTPITLLQYASN